MTPQEFETRVVTWAQHQSGLEALIQIGSRVQAGADLDEWSDWDYHLITRNPEHYWTCDWLPEIAPCWNAHLERTDRGVVKLSAVYSGGFEADFVPLSAWQMKLVYWAMARPGLRSAFPSRLLRGIYNTQIIVRPGYRVVIGGSTWEERLTALNAAWPKNEFTNIDYQYNVTGFWRHAIWVQKKIMRGETRAALRWYQVELTKHRWALLEEEARIAGRPVRPEARKAEKWLDARRLEQTAIETSTDQQMLARGLLAEMALFEEVTRSVAASRGWSIPDTAAVAAWLRQELNRVLNQI
ncbi:MAG TPA: hypothetical protein VG734_13945 [Lacunisphaera sp.]|nr:hypothetical protein [Lacunisphaera sp.]